MHYTIIYIHCKSCYIKIAQWAHYYYCLPASLSSNQFSRYLYFFSKCQQIGKAE